MSEVTAPIMTDATGQSIDSKLNSLLTKMDNLANAFQPNASGIVYSNSTSGLTGDDVQEAIDEMAADVSEIKQSLSDEILWNDSKYTSGDIQLSSPLKNGDHIMLIFKGLSSAYIQQFPFIIDTNLSTYLQIGFWGDSTQYCRYRMQVANNSTTFTINEVTNGNAGSALLRIVRTKKAS